MMCKSKVFGIGFHKTGTSSLAEALRILGYTVTGPNGVEDPEIARNLIPMVMKLTQEFDAFQDNPWPIVFREMDEACPGSKFILTIRNDKQWINSVCNHFGKKSTPMRKFIYGLGYPKGNERIYLKRYNDHNKEVLKYFDSRPHDLLVMDITKGDGWEKLCGFLGHDIPKRPFPKANTAAERSKSRVRKFCAKIFLKIKRKWKKKR